MFTDVLTARLSGYLRGLGVEASVEAHGSVAHDTWLLGDHDLDVFIVLPSGKREDLLRVLRPQHRPGGVEAEPGPGLGVMQDDFGDFVQARHASAEVSGA